MLPQRKGDPIAFAADEFVNRKTNAEALWLREMSYCLATFSAVMPMWYWL